MAKDTKLLKAATIALRDYMGLSDDETLLIITDEIKREIGQAMFEAGKQLCQEAFYIEMAPRTTHGEEPPEQISGMMRNVDVVVCPTYKSLTHTHARIRASEAGVRVATMPDIAIETMLRCFSADYKKVIELTEKVGGILKQADEVRITTKLGTDITMPRKKRRIIESTGVLRTIGASGNLPSGEVFFAPIEGKSNGKVIIDGSIAGLGMLDEPITVNFKDGMASRISGGKQAKELSAMLNEAGKQARNLAEFGIGTNYKAKICGHVLEDEKVFGTVHVAFGNNIAFGGKVDVPLHMDCVIKNPTVYADDEMIMKNGKLIEQ